MKLSFSTKGWHGTTFEDFCSMAHDLDFGGIDLLFGEDGESGAPIVCEANSNAHFKTVERFEELIAEDAFIEHARVHGNYYGTLREPIESALREGCSVILDIDVQGAAKVREYVRNLPNNDPLKIGYVDIFILPPDMEELRRRLEGRGTDSPEVIERRLVNAEGEIARAGEYMFKVTNDDLAIAYKRLCDLIDALSGRM